MHFKAASPQLFHAAVSASNQPQAREKEAGNNTVFDEDKRIIHTGPNPLHN